MRGFADEAAANLGVSTRDFAAAIALSDQRPAGVNADPGVEGHTVLPLEEHRERLNRGDDVQSGEHGSPRVVFADARVAEQDQQLVAGGFVDVSVVTAHGPGATTPESFQRVAPHRIAELAGQPRGARRRRRT